MLSGKSDSLLTPSRLLSKQKTASLGFCLGSSRLRRDKLCILRFRVYAKAHSLRCPSFPGRIRVAGLLPGSARTARRPAPPRGAVAKEKPVQSQTGASGSGAGRTSSSILLRRPDCEHPMQNGKESPENHGFSGASLVAFCASRKPPAGGPRARRRRCRLPRRGRRSGTLPERVVTKRRGSFDVAGPVSGRVVFRICSIFLALFDFCCYNDKRKRLHVRLCRRQTAKLLIRSEL